MVLLHTEERCYKAVCCTKTDQTLSSTISQTLQLKFHLMSKLRPNNKEQSFKYKNTVKFQITVSDIVLIDMQMQFWAVLSSSFFKNSFSTPVKINSFSHKLLHALSMLCYLAH